MSFNISRRTALLSSLSLAGLSVAACANTSKSGNGTAAANGDFVTVDGQHFKLKGETYRFVGANIWYGANLGSTGVTGDRARLSKELDDLKAIGITNLRVLASSELSPLNNSLDPAIRTAEDGNYNEELLIGIDYLLAEMAKRDMKAVLYLTNFWEWSGGMVTYQYYTNGKYMNAGDPAHPWPAFADFSAGFYSNGKAIELYHHYVKTLVTRTNTVTGKPYTDDATIMSWQLCNEPRPGGSEANAKQNFPKYLEWISSTTGLIRSLDKNHLVSLGHEGLKGAVESEQMVLDAHAEIDYLTAHIWPMNWGWVDPKDMAGTYERGEVEVKNYIKQHIAMAEKLNKPLVFEEFGFARDGNLNSLETPTTMKDRFYGLIYKAVEDAVKTGGPVAGSNFWAWGGAGRAAHADYKMRRGETNYVGDPPHEPQGWYSVFNTDTSTKALIKSHAEAISSIKS